MRIYLSSPYERNRAETSWKTDVQNMVSKLDNRITLFDPCPDNCAETDIINDIKKKQDWLKMYSICADIVETDLAALNECRGILVYLPYKAVTFGTTHEMLHALDNRIPVVLVMPEGKDKVAHWLWGILGPQRIFDNLEEAVTHLVHKMWIVNGEKLNG